LPGPAAASWEHRCGPYAGAVVSRWSDLDRPPLSGSALAAGLTRAGFWREVRVVTESGSTNEDLLAAAASGAAEGVLLVAESQLAGRGRQGRAWVSPPRAGLTFSMLLRPASVPTFRWSWLPLLAGLSVQRAVGRLAEVEAALKWPNDLLIGPHRRKAAGLLVQVHGTAAVVGIGLNVTTTAAELPRSDSTSLALEAAACTDRDPLLRAIARQFAIDYQAWSAAAGSPDGSGLLPGYLAACDTIGRQVRATLPAGDPVLGTATGLDELGRLVIETPAGRRPLSAADVEHLRPTDQPAGGQPAGGQPAGG
jgi:BirA family transcriptional regulator, biotin operon repressor / biotin---[acetyl-CoA-carboxylase] ligase